MTILWV